MKMVIPANNWIADEEFLEQAFIKSRKRVEQKQKSEASVSQQPESSREEKVQKLKFKMYALSLTPKYFQ